MNAKDFFAKFASRYLWGNLLAMVAVVVLLMVGVHYGLSIYTHHGEGVAVPQLQGQTYQKARMMLEEIGLTIVVSDSGYNKTLPADCILAQSPGVGTNVKEGHAIYVTVNSPKSPTFAIPDIVDNCSLREAEVRLMAMGFKLLPPQQVEGEKDWVYGILCRGRRISNGDRISIEEPLTLLVGKGLYETYSDEDDYSDPAYGIPDNAGTDDFEEVPDPLAGIPSSTP